MFCVDETVEVDIMRLAEQKHDMITKYVSVMSPYAISHDNDTHHHNNALTSCDRFISQKNDCSIMQMANELYQYLISCYENVVPKCGYETYDEMISKRDMIVDDIISYFKFRLPIRIVWNDMTIRNITIQDDDIVYLLCNDDKCDLLMDEYVVKWPHNRKSESQYHISCEPRHPYHIIPMKKLEKNQDVGGVSGISDMKHIGHGYHGYYETRNGKRISFKLTMPTSNARDKKYGSGVNKNTINTGRNIQFYKVPVLQKIYATLFPNKKTIPDSKQLLISHITEYHENYSSSSSSSSSSSLSSLL